ncbi:uncharacterized protein LOC132930042 [Rhopalosiphum padi]|uniref:uncharacterized protein LOC132930042 n=1 Tax=Rhopalosiphum padi TaxID=40932 RepID=UPI00298EA929|nr:uncharacterized protein LOC132930042 [Rhopalosiphum padi]
MKFNVTNENSDNKIGTFEEYMDMKLKKKNNIKPDDIDQTISLTDEEIRTLILSFYGEIRSHSGFSLSTLMTPKEFCVHDNKKQITVKQTSENIQKIQISIPVEKVELLSNFDENEEVTESSNAQKETKQPNRCDTEDEITQKNCCSSRIIGEDIGKTTYLLRICYLIADIYIINFKLILTVEVK